MTVVNIHQAKTHLSRLLRRVAAGEEIVIARSGTPVARLVPMDGTRMYQIGTDPGAFKVPEDFDEPLPESVLASFED
jgi:prevent-host-death family protein